MMGLSAVKIPSKSRDVRPCGCSLASWSRIRSTTLTTRIFSPGAPAFSSSAAATVSTVGTSPAQASTTSGSSPGTSEPANSQMPRPRWQWCAASAGPSQVGEGCLPLTTMLT